MMKQISDKAIILIKAKKFGFFYTSKKWLLEEFESGEIALTI